MRSRPLPFIKSLAALKPEDKLVKVNEAMQGVLQQHGFQLIFEILQETEHTSLSALRVGAGAPAAHAERIRTVEHIRQRILQLLPQPAPEWAEPEEEYEVEQIYESPFDITPPLIVPPIPEDDEDSISGE